MEFWVTLFAGRCISPDASDKFAWSLFAVHDIQKLHLLFFFKKGKFTSRVQGNFLIHHVRTVSRSNA